jgi:serine/threonine-protein kinase
MALSRGTQLDGRFQIEGLLGKGGMGAVYRASIPALDQRIALKRLAAGANAKHVGLFEREYHTLVSLKHPNVVDVFDYGTDSDGPWYTMELLEGGDLSKVAPLPWADVCRILRQLALALASIHARRMLHRDISARNVWRTLDGRIKLIDFGALHAFGSANDLIGTLPFISPEALHGQLLDQRTDLYAVGVLGYYLLTGLYPFPARDPLELKELWRHPPKSPATRLLELDRADLPRPPEEVEVLIEALLKREPMARPGSAAELIERIDAIVPPALDVTGPVVAASLGMTEFVGRTHVMDGLSRALRLAVQGIGSAAVIEAEPGIGRTRLLTEFAVRVRFSGGTALQVDPAPYRGELYGVAQAFALKLLDTLPELAQHHAAPHAAVLGHLSVALRERLGLAPDALAEISDTPGEARMCVQAALASWFMNVAKERPLVLLADDLHSHDEASAAWLAALARSANQAKLLVVCTLRSDAIDQLERVVQSLRQAATTFTLAPLTSTETWELLRSILGEVPRLGRLVEILQRVCRGAPAYTLELVEHLVHQGTITYAAGAWALPQDLDPEQLPGTRSAALAARLSRLTPDARALAQVLSLVDGRISVRAVKALAGREAAATFGALGLLVRVGVLFEADGDYAFAHGTLREVLGAELDATRRATAHRTLGELIVQGEAPSVTDRLRAGVHLMQAGELERGSRLAWQACRDLAITHITEQPVCLESMELALSLMRQHGRPMWEQMPVLGALTGAGFYVDRKLAMRYGSETIDAFTAAVKLPLARRLRPFLGRTLSLLIALALAAVVLRWPGRKSRGLDFDETMLLLFASVACLTGVYTICIDAKRAAACAQVIEPFSALGKSHGASLMYDFCVAIASTVSDRLGETYARWELMTERLKGTEPIQGLPDSLRIFYMAGGLYALGIMASWRDDARALRIADELDALELKLYEMNADQVRMMYYGNQGDRARFEHYRERVEMHAIQRGTAWQAETWAAAAQLTVYLRTFDGTRMKHCVDQLQRIGVEVPSMAHFVERSRGFYFLLRDKPKEAEALLSDALHATPLESVSWAGWCGSLAWAYNALGDHSRAHDLCQHVMSHLSPQDRTFPALNLLVETELSLAEAGLGNHAEAARIVSELLDTHGPNQGPLTVGSVHETGAKIALQAGDTARFEAHFVEMERCYRATKTASLIGRCDRLAKLRAPNAEAQGDDLERRSRQLGEHLQTVLYQIRHGGSGSALDRARWALAQLSQYLPGNDGQVYLVTPDGAERLGALIDENTDGASSRPPLSAEQARVDAWVRQRLLARMGSRTMTATIQDLAALATINQVELSNRAYRLLFLHAFDEQPSDLVGALLVPAEVADAIPRAVLEAVATRLKTLTSQRLSYVPPPLEPLAVTVAERPSHGARGVKLA